MRHDTDARAIDALRHGDALEGAAIKKIKDVEHLEFRVQAASLYRLKKAVRIPQLRRKLLGDFERLQL